MNPKLPQEFRQALDEHPGQPLTVEDSVTHAQYVLIQVEAYERLRKVIDYDASEPDPRDFYPAFAQAVENDLANDGMVGYEANDSQS